MSNKDEFKYINEKYKEVVEFLTKHKKIRRVNNWIFLANMYFSFILTPWGWTYLKNPQKRRFLFDRKRRVGMLEHSIIQNPLYAPSDDESELEYNKSVAGRWSAYDFHRREELRKDFTNKVTDGRLYCFLIEEVRDNKKEDYTPTYLLDTLSIPHILQIEFPSIDYLVEQELVEPTTYRIAYQRAGVYERYARFIDSFGILDNDVYQVTPKGNGLVFISHDTGKPVEKREGLKKLVLQPAFN